MVRREGGGRGISLCCRQQIIKLKLGATRRRLAAHFQFQIVVDPARELQLGKLPSVFRILRGELQMFGRTLTMEYAADQWATATLSRQRHDMRIRSSRQCEELSGLPLAGL